MNVIKILTSSLYGKFVQKQPKPLAPKCCPKCQHQLTIDTKYDTLNTQLTVYISCRNSLCGFYATNKHDYSFV
jgi:hypothetical protein